MTFDEWGKQDFTIYDTTQVPQWQGVTRMYADWKQEREKYQSHRKEAIRWYRRFKEEQAKNEKLIKVLEDIANSSHQTYDGKDGQYGIGVADGHRCAANIARAVLKEVGK